MKYSYKIGVLRVVPALLALTVWQLAVIIRPGYEFFIGSPVGIAIEARALFCTGVLPEAIAITGFEALLGFLAGSILGSLSGLLLWNYKGLKKVFGIYLTGISAVPIFALGPVLVFWFGTGLWSKVVLGFLSTFALAVSQAYNGATEADPNLQKLLRIFGANQRDVLFKLIVPSSLIWVLAGIRINIGLALLGAFIGEFIASKAGLGYMIIVAQGLYDVNQIWVGVGGIIFIATIFYLLTGPIERRARRWQEPYNSGT
jgi:NitT/TauT family transport system permease protein